MKCVDVISVGLFPGLVDDAAHGAVVLLVVDLEPLDEVDAQPLRVCLLDVRVELPVLEDEPAGKLNN